MAFVGDGGFSMLMAEFATAVKYQLPIKVVVLKNNSLGQIKWEQMVFLGNPEYGCELQPIDFAAFARACGGQGFTIEDPATCGAILDEALAMRGPVLIEAVVDPYEPPMPPSVTVEQAAHFAKSLAKGEPNRKKIALTVARGQNSGDGLRAGNGPAPGALYVDVSEQHQHDDDRQNCSQPSAGIISPTTAVRPCGGKGQDQNYQ